MPLLGHPCDTMDSTLTNKNIISHVKEIIEGHLYLDKDGDCYYGDIYADYRDKLSFDSIKKIVQSDNSMETFYDQFYVIECEDCEYSFILNTIRDHWDYPKYGNFEEHEDNIREWIHENVYFNFPYDHFLKQEVKVNIIVNTGDGNYDYTLNNFASYNSVPGEVINNKSSILWLVKQQGYSKTQLNNAVRKEEFDGSKFLKSVFQELINVTTHMNALAFFVKMTLKEFIDLKENPRKIILPANTSCGLYDPWNGAGSVLEIELDKEVVIPKRFAEPHIDGTRGYGIDEIYGMCGSFWG